MAQPKKLYKTTIVIWSEFETSDWEISALSSEAESGDAFCSDNRCELVFDKAQFPETEFFYSPIDDEEEA